MYRRRRFIAILMVAVGILFALVSNGAFNQTTQPVSNKLTQTNNTFLATDALQKLLVKGRAPKTDYSREQFGAGWVSVNGCDTRNIILHRDLINSEVDQNCNVINGILHDPYTAKTITFVRGSGTSTDVQIDHVVALSDAWQKGAQQLTKDQRVTFANDPLELLAVDGPANQQKSDGDAATWLPSNKPFRCQYVARQIAVKQKYNLWLTLAEKNAIISILSNCPLQGLPLK